MTAITPIVHVRTDRRGHDTLGDGSYQHPFRTVARARSDYPDAVIFVDDVFTSQAPQQLTEVGEQALLEVDQLPRRESDFVLVAAVMAGFIIGVSTRSPLWAILGAAVVAVALALFDRRVPR